MFLLERPHARRIPEWSPLSRFVVVVVVFFCVHAVSHIDFDYSLMIDYDDFVTNDFDNAFRDHA